MNLSAWFDNGPTMDLHVGNIYDFTVYKLGIIAMTMQGNCLSTKIALLLSQSLILPILDYYNTVYMVALQVQIRKTAESLKCTLKHMLKADGRTPIYGLHKLAKIATLVTSRIKHLTGQLFQLAIMQDHHLSNNYLYYSLSLAVVHDVVM